MIDLYYWPTPNGHKITLFLEETGLPYTIKPIDIGKGDQFSPEFLAISPNNRIPAMVDQAPSEGGDPIALFESGAILMYLAEKSGQLLPHDFRQRHQVMQWLFWQVGGLGPMLGQNHHFNLYATEKVPYAMERYVRETRRLYGVLNKQLSNQKFIIGDHLTIADCACYPWIVPWQQQSMVISDFPHLQRWFETIAARPATQRAYAWEDTIKRPPMDEAQRAILFGSKSPSR